MARNPCHSIGNLVDPGPTVDDLVAALEAQSMRHATKPTDVTLGGYSGKYLEWSVPKHWVVTGDGDFKGCDVQDDGHRDFVSWLGNGGDGERWQQMAGQVDRLWVLDVNGQRLVVDANYSPGTTQAQRDEEDQIVQSLQFVPAPRSPARPLGSITPSSCGTWQRHPRYAARPYVQCEQERRFRAKRRRSEGCKRRLEHPRPLGHRIPRLLARRNG